MSLPPPDLLAAARGQASFMETLAIRVVRASLDSPTLDRVLQYCQRTVGQAWIHGVTANLRVVVGLERVGDLSTPESVIVVANHRSYFDLYVVAADLVRRGLRKRLLFPVRSSFFYDRPLGPVVNFLMSFLAMYPPLFRDPRRAALNLAALDELADLLGRGDVLCGLHPEGTRNRGEDPYRLLPARSGVGRVIHRSRARVIPVFVNGLVNDVLTQIRDNFRPSGTPVLVVYGEPVDFGDLRSREPSAAVYRAISERCLDAIRALGEEERALRSAGTHR